jgi:subtilisin family serine protease
VAPLRRGLDGRGVRIGFLDAHYRGLQHPAFARLRRDGRLLGLRSFPEGRQGGNHGAAVASVAVGHAPGTLLGPAHGAQVLGATTEYTPSERNVEEDYFVAGLEWLHRRGADVVNVSIGYNTFDEGQESYTTADLDGDTGITTRAVDRAAALGMTVVVSAGNSGCATPDSCWYYVNTPADADSAIVVGAMRPDSSLAPFSSRGPTADGRRKPDVVVQGTDVVAAWDDGGYARVGGTSFASPQVTGVVAQMLQVNPALSPVQVRRLLRQTASQATRPDNRRGWGVLNADAAVRAAERRARAHPPPALRVELPPTPVADTALSLPVRVPARTPSLRVTLTSPLGRVGTDTTFAVRPGPNWLRLDLRAVPPGLYRYRVAGPRDARTGTLVVARPARSKPGPVGMK